MSITRTAFGSRQYADAMDAAWRETKSHLGNGLPLTWIIQRARAIYRQAWREEVRRTRTRPC